MAVTKYSDLLSGDFPGLATVSSWYVQPPALSQASVVRGKITKVGVPITCKYPQLVASCDINLDEIETKQVKRKNKMVDVPSNVTVEPFTIIVNEDADYNMLKYFKFWRSLVVDDAGFHGVEGVYRYDVPLTVYKKISHTPSNPPKVIRLIARGAFPSGGVQLNYSRSNEPLTLQVKMSHLGIFIDDGTTQASTQSVSSKLSSIGSAIKSLF